MPRTRVGQILDAFERSDRPLDGIWTVRGPSEYGAVIVDGHVEMSNFPQAFYAEAVLPDRPTRIAAEFALVGTDGANCGPVLLLSQDGGRVNRGAYHNMIHYVVNPGVWSLNVYEDDTPSAAIASGSLDLALDGTVYSFGVRLDGSDTITLELPDGTETSVTDTRFSERQGRYFEFESYAFPGSGQDVVTRWESITIDVERRTVERDAVASRTPVASRSEVA